MKIVWIMRGIDKDGRHTFNMAFRSRDKVMDMLKSHTKDEDGVIHGQTIYGNEVIVEKTGIIE